MAMPRTKGAPWGSLASSKRTGPQRPHAAVRRRPLATSQSTRRWERASCFEDMRTTSMTKLSP
jgi:hypothetical protein